MIMYTENAFAYEYAYTIQVQIHICMNMHMHIYKCPSPYSYIVLAFAFPSKYDFVMMASCSLYEFNMCPSVNLSSIFNIHRNATSNVKFMTYSQCEFHI